MVRRFLCLGTVLVILLSVPACGSDSKNKGPIVPDPDGNVVPKAGSKAG